MGRYRSRRAGRAWWALVPLALLALGCASPAAPAGAGEGAPSAPLRATPASAPAVAPSEARHTTVAYPSNSVTMTGFYIAVAGGFAAEEGLDVEMLRLLGTASAQSMLARQVDFGMSAGTLLSAYMRGAPMRNVFVQIDKPIFYLFTQPDVERPADIEGKAVGIVSLGDSTHLAVKAALRGYGVDPDRVTYAPNVLGTQAVAALQSHAVVATSIAPPFDIVAERAGYRRQAFMGDYLDYLTAGLGTHEDLIRDQPELVQAVVRAELKAHRFMQQNRAGTIAHMAQWLDVPLEDAQLGYDLYMRYLTADGTSTPEVLERILADQRRELLEQGTEPQATTVAEAFRLEFARRANEQLDAAGWRP